MTPAETFLGQHQVIPGRRRWTPSRKEAFLSAISRWPEEAEALMRTYEISPEEIESWRRASAAAGRTGLKATRVAPPAERVVIEDPDGNLHGTGVVIASADAHQYRPEDLTLRQREILSGYKWAHSAPARRSGH